MQRIEYELQCLWRIAQYQLCTQAQHAKPVGTQCSITPRILALALVVMWAIDFDNQARPGREEVCDGAVQDDLAAKPNTEL